MSQRADPRSPGSLSPGAGVVALVAVVVVAALVGREILAVFVGDSPRLSTWSTLFLAIVVQALPFLALGVAVGGVIAVLVPDRVLRRGLPRNASMAVPVATMAGVALPGCECGSVPLARRLMDRGVPRPAAVAFMLSSPAINPLVLVATAVAFPGRPEMVLARFVASALLALIVGWVWSRWGTRPEHAALPAEDDDQDDHENQHDGEPPTSRGRALLEAFQHDFLQSAGLLVVGAACAATLQLAVPPDWAAAAGSIPVVSVLVMAGLAVLLAVCSEADAFVAASFTGFSPTAQLAFMVIGPAIDVKLIAMHTGTFGSRFASRLAPLVFTAGVASALVVGGLLL